MGCRYISCFNVGGVFEPEVQANSRHACLSVGVKCASPATNIHGSVPTLPSRLPKAGGGLEMGGRIHAGVWSSMVKHACHAGRLQAVTSNTLSCPISDNPYPGIRRHAVRPVISEQRPYLVVV